MHPSVDHHPGRHCASTALCNLTHFHQAPLSEAMCFGLGEGLGIFYLGLPGLAPSRFLAARSLDFERIFFERLGIPFTWDQHEDPAASEAALMAVLDAGRPAVVQTDIFYLPHFGSKTHFTGHLITVWGYDRERQVFNVTDTEHADVFEVPFDAMRKARYCKVPPFPMTGNLFAPASIALPADLPVRMWAAIQSNSQKLISSEQSYEGLAALRQWREEFGTWAEFEDWKWTARFAYQTILKRGTGGGGFRHMYADFLEEATPGVPQINERKLAGIMRATAEAWDQLALALKEISEQDAFAPGAAVKALANVITLETHYHETALR